MGLFAFFLYFQCYCICYRSWYTLIFLSSSVVIKVIQTLGFISLYYSAHFQIFLVTCLFRQVYLSSGSRTRLIWTSDNVTLLHILKVQLPELFFHLHTEGLVSMMLRLFQSSTNLTAKETAEALKMRLKTLCGTEVGSA